MNDTRIDGNINNKSWNDRKRKKREENVQRKTSYIERQIERKRERERERERERDPTSTAMAPMGIHKDSLSSLTSHSLTQTDNWTFTFLHRLFQPFLSFFLSFFALTYSL